MSRSPELSEEATGKLARDVTSLGFLCNGTARTMQGCKPTSNRAFQGPIDNGSGLVCNSSGLMEPGGSLVESGSYSVPAFPGRAWEGLMESGEHVVRSGEAR